MVQVIVKCQNLVAVACQVLCVLFKTASTDNFLHYSLRHAIMSG